MYRTRALIAPLTSEEQEALETVAGGDASADVQRRVRGILSLSHGHRPRDIADILGVSEHTVYNWAKWWRERRLAGLLGGHNGGRPPVLTAAYVKEACEIAQAEALTLEGIQQRLRERHPDLPSFSNKRLAVRLKEQGFSFKRCRLSLKKSVVKNSSRQRGRSWQG